MGLSGGLGGIFGGIDTLVWGDNADKVYGKKPELFPKLPTLEEAQKTAVSGNIANFSDIAKLATMTNTLNQDQLDALLDRTLGPGVRQQFQENIAAGARGELPEDAVRAISRYNAGRNVGALTRGSGFSNSTAARQIGQTSLQRMDAALSSAEQWLASAKAPNMDITRSFIDTTQQYAASLDQANYDILKAKIAAAPDPAARGQFDSTMALLGMVLSAYGGGAGYQGTYNPNAAYTPNYGGNAGTAGGPSAANGGWYIGGNNYGFGRSGAGQLYMGKGPGLG